METAGARAGISRCFVNYAYVASELFGKSPFFLSNIFFRKVVDMHTPSLKCCSFLSIETVALIDANHAASTSAGVA